MQKSTKVPKTALKTLSKNRSQKPSKNRSKNGALATLPNTMAAKKLPTLKKKTQALPAKSARPKSVVKAPGKKVSKAPAAAKKVSAPIKPVSTKEPAKKSGAATVKAAGAAGLAPGTTKDPKSANHRATATKEIKSTPQSPLQKAAGKLEPKSTKVATVPGKETGKDASKKVSGSKPDSKQEAKSGQATEIDHPVKADAKIAKGKKAKVEEAPPEPEEEIVLLDAEGRRYCRVRECDQASAVDGYCRFHYLLFWKNIQVRKKILSEGKLERYIEELTARYPDKYLEMLKKDLRSEKEFLAAIQELEIDESSVDNEYEDEAQNYLDEVRGMSSETGSNDRDEEF